MFWVTQKTTVSQPKYGEPREVTTKLKFDQREDQLMYVCQETTKDLQLPPESICEDVQSPDWQNTLRSLTKARNSPELRFSPTSRTYQSTTEESSLRLKWS